MIPNQWYILLESKQIKDKPVGVTRMGEKVVFWRDATGLVSCLRDKCVHRGVELSKGQVLDGNLRCPFHGFCYDASGRVALIPANGEKTPVPEVFRVHRYPTYEAHGFIWVWWGESPPAELKLPRFFDDLDDGFTYGSLYDPWEVHYSRVIENQLDVAHVPFIHYNTIGRGIGPVVDGPGLQWIDEGMFFIYPYNRFDDGTPARKPSEVPVPPTDREFKLEFIFPNLWQNYIGKDIRVLAAFVPVDEGHTLVILRFYQRFMRLPVLRDVVTRLSMPYNLKILHQDRRVMVTHQPQVSGLKIGEKLIPADQPIIEYRRRREALIEATRQSRGEM
jgi:phenylpropionate dioxygenase-like ring-hydroxylating dioxygenase large terminal subunit